jgi:hypothetical protein
VREVLLPDVVVLNAIAGFGADVVDDDLKVHLGLAAETFDVGQEVALIGADRAAQSVVVLKGSAETEGKNRGTVEAPGDHSSVIAGSGLGIGADQTSGVLSKVFRDHNSKIGGRKEKYLISKESSDPSEGHWTAVTG